MCPLKNGTNEFVEASILIASHGPLAGEYVARCAARRCGYHGQQYVSRYIINC